MHFVSPGWRFPILRENLAGRFEGNTPELSCSFSLEKSCSLSRLRCPHDWSEWIAIIRRNLSRSSGVLAGCERVNAEVRREALQHYARQPLKLDQKERNPETQGMKSYGGFSTYVGLEPIVVGRQGAEMALPEADVPSVWLSVSDGPRPEPCPGSQANEPEKPRSRKPFDSWVSRPRPLTSAETPLSRCVQESPPP